MSNLASKKTKTSKKLYLTYIDNSGDKITLSFRSEKSAEQHFNRNKISIKSIKYKSNKRPRNPDLIGSLWSMSPILKGRTTKTGVSNG
ncbi:hypothetical protein ACFQZE_06285 [Paenibacillus sp. GCM10027627]|uniref:hypothetical protein n=1 Tax=unclassified Paenibacillus TaxID=185978 RepID=UPI00363154FC